MPIRDADAKEDILDALLTSKRRAQRLALRLRLLRRRAEAERVNRRARRLAREIDALIGKAMDAWPGSASAVEQEITSVNRRLARTITSIKKSIEIAANVVKATGLVDDAIRIAARLAA